MSNPAAALMAWYERAGRSTLPWRTHRDPYRTLVSEFMLQQTQVDRVVPKFDAFMAAFPDIAALASATTADVLRLWQGLGYNSRAVRLKGVAQEVVERYGGVIPSDRAALLALKGVGAYTAAAIRAFGYDLDDVALDTNIRRIVHRVFFGVEVGSVRRDRDIDARAPELMIAGRAHDSNSALMDLGATVCTARAPRCFICPLRDACAAAPLDAALLERMRAAAPPKRSPQERIPFEQTTRYARGRIVDRLRELPAGATISLLDLHAALRTARSADDVRALVGALERDGLVHCEDERVRLRD